MNTFQAADMTVGKRLKIERQRLGMSLEDFGDKGGVGKGAQINYEKDARDPDAKYLLGIHEAGADLLFVLTGERNVGVLGEREQSLLASFHLANEEGRKVIERIAEIEAARSPKKATKKPSVQVKGHGNAVGSNITMGSVVVGETKTKKR